MAIYGKTDLNNITVDLHVDTASIKIGGSKGYLFVKRLADILLSLIGLVCLFVPMAIIGIIIVLDSAGPAIYS